MHWHTLTSWCKTLWKIVFCVSCMAPVAHARAAQSGWCMNGGVSVSIPGTQGSGTQKFQQSYPSCTVTVYNSGTLVLATIFADNAGTAKANPFTAASNGQWFFYANDGAYDVKFSGVGIPTPFTIGGYTLFDSAGFPSAALCQTSIWCQGAANGSTTLTNTIGLAVNAGQSSLTITAANSNANIVLGTASAFGPTGSGTVTINSLTGTTGPGVLTLNTGTLNLSSTSTVNSGTFTSTGNGTFSSALSVGGAATVGSLVSNASGSIATTLGIGSYLEMTDIALPTSPAVGKVRLFPSSGGGGTCSGSAFVPDKLYYVDSTGLCNGPLLTGGSGSSGWLLSTTTGGTNTLAAKSFIGGNSNANLAIGIVQNGVEVMTLGTNQFVGIGLPAATNPARRLEVRDVSNQIVGQFTGPASGGSGAEIDFYETTQLDGSIGWGNGISIASASTFPIHLYQNGTAGLTVKIAAGTVRTVTGQVIDINPGLAAAPACPAGTGSMYYDNVLNHLYFCENAGAWAQFGTGGSAGWNNGSAANAGLNNDGSNRFIGLLSNFAMGFATNSSERMRITKDGFVGIGTVGADPNRMLEVKDTGNSIVAQFTGAAAGSEIDFYNTTTLQGGFAWNASNLNINTVAGVGIKFNPAGSIALALDSADRAQFATSTAFSTGGTHRVTISSGDYAQLALFSTGVNSKMTIASTVAATPTPGGELFFNGNDFAVNTAAHLTAAIQLQTGSSRTRAMTVTSGQQVLVNNLTGTPQSPLSVMEIRASSGDATQPHSYGLIIDLPTEVAGPVTSQIVLSRNGGGQGALTTGTAANVGTILQDTRQTSVCGNGSTYCETVYQNGTVGLPVFDFVNLPAAPQTGIVICKSCLSFAQDVRQPGSACQVGAANHYSLAFYNPTAAQWICY